MYGCQNRDQMPSSACQIGTKWPILGMARTRTPRVPSADERHGERRAGELRRRRALPREQTKGEEPWKAQEQAAPPAARRQELEHAPERKECQHGGPAWQREVCAKLHRPRGTLRRKLRLRPPDDGCIGPWQARRLRLFITMLRRTVQPCTHAAAAERGVPSLSGLSEKKTALRHEAHLRFVPFAPG
jgi:hypothetical protein